MNWSEYQVARKVVDNFGQHNIIQIMLNKMWQSIQAWMESFIDRKQPIPPTVLRRPPRTRFLIDSTQTTQQPQLVQQPKIVSRQIPQNQEELQTLYSLICLEDNTPSFDNQQQENEEFLHSLNEISQKLKSITLQAADHTPNEEPLRRMEQITHEMKRVNNCSQEERQLYLQYRRDILTVLEGKYLAERPDYPDIPFEQYKQIRSLWSEKGREIERAVPGCPHLKVKDIQLLANRNWLNDEIISEYISLLKEQIQEGQKIKIVNSLQVATFFDKRKYDEAKVHKFFSRQKITQQDTILMTVHKVNHWIFIKLSRNSLLIYDSIFKANVEDYLKFPTLHNIYLFAQGFYGDAPQLRSMSDFPQQANDYDCGMMMLCGIKDVVKGSLKWNFRQEEIPYRRYAVAKELMEHKLTGF